MSYSDLVTLVRERLVRRGLRVENTSAVDGPLGGTLGVRAEFTDVRSAKRPRYWIELDIDLGEWTHERATVQLVDDQIARVLR